VVGNTVTAVLVGNVAVFFILRNCERMKVKGKRSIGLVVHRPRKARRPDGQTHVL
jgi:hypothetical protein